MSTDNVGNFAALRAEGDIGFWRRREPRCPHCGATFNVSKNDAWRIYEEGSHDLTCPSCTHDFEVRATVTYQFSTDAEIS